MLQSISSLSIFNLDSDLGYECSSYVWGTDDHDQPIVLSNLSSSFLVSSTLYTALEHLRHASQERTVWVDAISINQTDITERSAHVAIMKNMYRTTTRLTVWLGPATESSDQAIDF